MNVRIIRPHTIKPKVKKDIFKVDPKVSHAQQYSMAIHNLNAAFENVKAVVLERSVEVDAIKLCILIKQHMMLEGRHGIAKSMLAEEIFRRIKGARHFEKILMKGTQPDEIFGPMNSKIYREQGKWVHNTEGYLPEADFAFLDEVYRGSDSLLGSLMGTLNERKFHNGPVLMRCPLITAIGTTNFQTDAPELEAFHDRWLVKAIIQPLKNKNIRLKMLQGFLDRMDPDDDNGTTVSLEDINLLQKAIFNISITQEILDLFDELVLKVVNAMPGKLYFSDRRLCLTLNLVLAEALMKSEDKLKNGGTISVEPDHLTVVEFGICQLGDPRITNLFNSQYSSVVGGYAQREKERKSVEETTQFVDKLRRLFDPDLDRAELELLRDQVKETYEVITNLSGDEAPRLPVNIRKFEEMAYHLKSLISEIELVPSMGIKKAAQKVREAEKNILTIAKVN
jgi:MoxR-like ATPase